jgi:hypothetical protein
VNVEPLNPDRIWNDNAIYPFLKELFPFFPVKACFSGSLWAVEILLTGHIIADKNISFIGARSSVG